MAVFSVYSSCHLPLVCVYVQILFLFKTPDILDRGPPWGPHLTYLHLQRSCFQIVSHSEFWGLEFHHEPFFGGRHNSSHVNFPSILYLIVKQRYGSARAEVSRSFVSAITAKWYIFLPLKKNVSLNRLSFMRAADPVFVCPALRTQ